MLKFYSLFLTFCSLSDSSLRDSSTRSLNVSNWRGCCVARFISRSFVKSMGSGYSTVSYPYSSSSLKSFSTIIMFLFGFEKRPFTLFFIIWELLFEISTRLLLLLPILGIAAGFGRPPLDGAGFWTPKSAPSLSAEISGGCYAVVSCFINLSMSTPICYSRCSEAIFLYNSSLLRGC